MQPNVLSDYLVRNVSRRRDEVPSGPHVWRSRHQDMHVIFRHMTLENLNLVRPANLTDHLTEPQGNLTAQDRLPVFRRPHEVVLDVKTSVC